MKRFDNDVALLKLMATVGMQYVEYLGTQQYLYADLQFMALLLGIDTIVGPNPHWDILLYTPHLYEACRQYGREHGIDVSWPDMDAFMEAYEKESLFAGRVPETPADFIKINQLVAGASINSILWSTGRKGRMCGDKLFAAPGGQRMIMARSYTALLFRDRHFQRGACEYLDPATPIDPQNQSLHDSLGLPACLRLRALLDALPGDSHDYRLDANFEEQTQMEQFHNDVELLKAMAHLGMQYVEHPGVKKYLHVDVFLEELQQYLATKKTTLTLLVATTYFLQVHHMLGDVFLGMTQTLRNLDPHPLHGRDMTIANDSSLAWVLHWHPWLCGQLQFLVIQLGNDAIVGTHPHWDFLISTAFLYEACQRYGGEHDIDISWPDLDVFMSLYVKESLFGGRVPEAALDFLNSYAIVSGHSLSAILPLMGHQERLKRNALSDRTFGVKGASVFSPAGQRKIKSRSYTTLMFCDWLFPPAVGATSPLDRSSNFVTRINNLVDDLVTTSAVALT
ncbi:hypothetical protein GGF32_000380 [Allomyces javanicus]|nr:hypothetical protein GGF32_000380 [Allomyces javanicus]